MIYTVGAIFFAFFVVLWTVSRLSPAVYLKRLTSCRLASSDHIPDLFQEPVHESFTTIAYPAVRDRDLCESVGFASILLVKFLVSVSFIILLSSTTRTRDLPRGAGRLGLPAEFTLTLGMMLRYLYVFGYDTEDDPVALETRCFNPFDRTLPCRYAGWRRWRMPWGPSSSGPTSRGNGRTAMLCRGYGRESHLYASRKNP